uniref:Putative bacteriophage-related protein n=1 Tax=Magnetococcus massalia (strain MO-1) TaxID=451514 RepID=A0A1S7LJ05_MAGMO|nr:Putative bacteriophage-related protein [Candidatus Magnetococcus massalia]
MAMQSVPQVGENENRAILALDLGSQMGWALQRPDGEISSGSISFKPGRFEGGGMGWVRFADWLDQMHFSHTINQISFELVRGHTGTLASQVYGGFLAYLTGWAEKNGVPYQGIPVGTIKKFATGKGNASKAQVIHAMKRLGHDPEDDNAADALALLHYVLGQGGAQ